MSHWRTISYEQAGWKEIVAQGSEENRVPLSGAHNFPPGRQLSLGTEAEWPLVWFGAPRIAHKEPITLIGRVPNRPKKPAQAR